MTMQLSATLTQDDLGSSPRLIGLGGAVIAIFFVSLTVWSMTIPLERAAVASGSLVVEGSRRQVQHLEGGIVRRILVREGAAVAAGQPLMLLDDTIPRTQVELLSVQLAAAQSQAARLHAEAEDRGDIAFPEELTRQRPDPKVAQILDGESRIFQLRKDALSSQVDLLAQRSRQSREEISGLRQEIAAQDSQLELINSEIRDVQTLLSSGLERMPRMRALQRTKAEIEGARGQNVARVARAEQVIIENEMRAVDLRVQQASSAAQKLRDEEARVSDLSDRVRLAKDTLARTVIAAPVSGRIMNVRVFTENGVINPRETLMEIVPTEEQLVVDAQVSPNDVDIVRVGADVSLRFITLSQRQTPVISGTVDALAADRQVDARTGQFFYTARIVVTPAEFKRVDARLSPGMPVEVSISGGSHTFFDYLLNPLFGWTFGLFKEK